jgi:membrane protein required for colicin V production
VAAAGACVFFVLKYKEEARGIADQFHAPVLVAQVAIGGIIFLIVLIIVHLITARISDTVLDSRVGAIDRILGLLFGLARGFVLVVIPFMFYESFVDKPEQQYPWVRDAMSRPWIKSTGDSLKIMLQRMVPPSLMGQPEQQQGFILHDHNRPVTGAGGKRVRVVLYPARPAQRS